jgi:glycosyltransferase involved in cell wall biosynthesis
MMTTRRKVLHVIGAMNRGGVETWLMHVMRNIDPDLFEIHFLVHSKEESAYDREILSLGGQIHYGADPRNPLRYATELQSVVRQCGGFDVIHSHVYWFSGFVMRLAHHCEIPIRVAHSHTAADSSGWNAPRKLYQNLMRDWIERYATHRIGISRHAGKALFGARAEEDFILLYYGVDFARFLNPLPPIAAKQRIGIDLGRKVIGHVGRFAAVKNHMFIVEFFARMLSEGANAHLLLVGEGPLVPSIQEQVRSRGLTQRCTFAGSQSDVAPYLAAMDVFVLPSHWEGFGLAAIESQAAGVPVIASTGVPNEIDVIPGLTEHIPLSAGESGWASAVRRKLEEPAQRRGNEAAYLQDSRFGIRTCLDTLCSIYLGRTPQAATHSAAA